MTELIDFLNLQSVLVLIFTFGVGYIALFWAYRRAGRLHVWHKLSDFDKAMRTFIVGGFISWFVFLFSNAPLDSMLPTIWWLWVTHSTAWFFFSMVGIVVILYLQGFIEGEKQEPKTETQVKPDNPASSSMPTASKTSESRKALGELAWLFGRLKGQIIVSIFVSLLITVLIFSRFFLTDKNVPPFLSGLLTLDSILIAVVALITPIVRDASQFVGFMEATIKGMHETANDPTKIVANSFYSQLAARSVILVVFLPILAIIPFFISAVIALVALLSDGYPTEILAFSSVWITLWCFLSIILAIWKLMMYERKGMKNALSASHLP